SMKQEEITATNRRLEIICRPLMPGLALLRDAPYVDDVSVFGQALHIRLRDVEPTSPAPDAFSFFAGAASRARVMDVLRKPPAGAREGADAGLEAVLHPRGEQRPAERPERAVVDRHGGRRPARPAQQGELAAEGACLEDGELPLVALAGDREPHPTPRDDEHLVARVILAEEHRPGGHATFVGPLGYGRAGHGASSEVRSGRCRGRPSRVKR